MIVVETAIIIILFFVYGYIHTFLASNKLKMLISKYYTGFLPYYRLAYNIYALASLWLIIKLSPKPDLILYDLPKPFDLIILIPQFGAIAGFLWTLRYVDAKEFLGISQIIRHHKKNYNFADLDERSELRTDGVFRLCRHPIYLFSILILIFRAQMTWFYFVALICIITYFYVGSIFEEKKLIEKFGNDYRNYQSTVPRIIPIKIYKTLL
jgi:protein-S-isoprenylcysteine O-methyltransferase Ste14